MKRKWKRIIRKTPFYHPVRTWTEKARQRKKLTEWERNGRPIPPPHMFKQQVLRQLSELYGLKILVETGTYHGDMIEAMKEDFDQIYSIELSKEFYEMAKKRFGGDKNIELIHGDSGVELGKVLRKIDRPAMFWLDGHYSAGATAKGKKDTPIYEELDHVFNAQDRGHVIVIDDARCFRADPAYPGFEELRGFVKSRRPDAIITNEYDSIRIAPANHLTN